MNKERILKLADQLERLPDVQFNMDTYIHHDCGTVACIAGWCSLLNEGPKEQTRWGREKAEAVAALRQLAA